MIDAGLDCRQLNRVHQ